MQFSQISHTMYAHPPIQFLLLPTFIAFLNDSLYIKSLCIEVSRSTEILRMISVQNFFKLYQKMNKCICLLCMQINHLQWMFGIDSPFGLSSNYLSNKNWTIWYFLIFISNRADFAVRGPSSLYTFLQLWALFLDVIKQFELIEFSFVKFETGNESVGKESCGSAHSYSRK